MGRPTKKEIEKRQSIIDLGVFVRDNEIYTNFEKIENDIELTPTQLSYWFCNQCEDRFESISIDSAIEYYNSLFYHQQFNKSCNNKSIYHSYTLVFTKDMEKALGSNADKALKQFENYVFTHLDPFYSKDSADEFLISSDDKHKIKSYYENLDYDDEKKYFTIVKKNYRDMVTELTGAERNTFVELDFTKPLEELIEFVTTVKNDYDSCPTKISSFHNLIGLDYKDFTCDIKECDIYKHKSPKPLSGKLMDSLFIYDCRRIGLHEDYIIDEINRYWNSVKNIHREKITKKSYRKYYNFAFDYIENKKFISFIHGTEKINPIL